MMKKIYLLILLICSSYSAFSQWTGNHSVTQVTSSNNDVFDNPFYFTFGGGGSELGGFMAMDLADGFYIRRVKFKAPVVMGIDANWIGMKYYPDLSFLEVSESMGIMFSYNPGKKHILDFSYQFLGFDVIVDTQEEYYANYFGYANQSYVFRYHHQLNVNYRWRSLMMGFVLSFNHGDYSNVDFYGRFGFNF